MPGTAIGLIQDGKAVFTAPTMPSIARDMLASPEGAVQSNGHMYHFLNQTQANSQDNLEDSSKIKGLSWELSISNIIWRNKNFVADDCWSTKDFGKGGLCDKQASEPITH
ncbi:hypothetical protein HJFPF1_12370 [Paramyrothecium foliicola]|nr:hypothetical protein HJFPF1_12370 [Paramyrothecium foliicola]